MPARLCGMRVRSRNSHPSRIAFLSILPHLVAPRSLLRWLSILISKRGQENDRVVTAHVRKEHPMKRREFNRRGVPSDEATSCSVSEVLEQFQGYGVSFPELEERFIQIRLCLRGIRVFLYFVPKPTYAVI